MYLDSPFELQGNWWLPSNPDKKISGILKCSKSGRVELEVMGTFFDLPTGINDLPTLPIILGTSDNGKSITLVHCMHFNLEHEFFGIGKF